MAAEDPDAVASGGEAEAGEVVEADAPPEGPNRTRVRRIASWVLTVAAGIAIAAAVVGVWVHRTVLETDSFMAAVTPALESEALRDVVADRLSDELIEALALEARVAAAMESASNGVTDALADAIGLTPEQVDRLDRVDFGLQALAIPIANGIEARIRTAVDDFVASRPAGDLLVNVVETAHERTVHLLRDELDQLPNVVIEDDEVRLNLVPIMAEALRSVINSGVAVVGIDREIPPFESAEEAEAAIERLAGLLDRELRPDFGQVSLMSEAQLQDAQQVVQTFDRLVWIFLGLAIVLGILAVVFAPSLQVGLLRLGITVAVAVLLGWLGVQTLTAALAEAASTPEGRVALADLVSAVVTTLQPMAAALGILGVGTAVAVVAIGRGFGRSSSEDVATS